MTNRRGFLASLTAALAAAGIGGKITLNTADDILVWRGRLRVRKDDGETLDIPLERTMPADVATFAKMFGEDELLQLATASFIVRAQAVTRSAIRSELESWDASLEHCERVAQRVFADFKQGRRRDKRRLEMKASEMAPLHLTPEQKQALRDAGIDIV